MLDFTDVSDLNACFVSYYWYISELDVFVSLFFIQHLTNMLKFHPCINQLNWTQIMFTICVDMIHKSRFWFETSCEKAVDFMHVWIMFWNKICSFMLPFSVKEMQIMYIYDWLSSELLALCEGNPLVTVDSPHKGPVMWIEFPCHDIIMFGDI